MMIDRYTCQICVREALAVREKRFSPKPEFQISLLTYLRDHGAYDKSLSSMHPYRRLRGVAQSLAEERRSFCLRILSACKFRQISVHGVSELIADVPQDELSGPNYSGIVTGFASLALIHISKVLDIPLPFPMMYGTIVSSSSVHSGPSVYESGCQPVPKILHAYKRTLQGVSGSSILLYENIRQVVSQANQVSVGSVLVQQDLLSGLSAIASGFALGREIPISQKRPPSPPLSAIASSPASASFRIIEQSVTEGGEWTLLDEL